MTNNVLNILVISDLHAHPGDPRKGDAPSHYSTNHVFNTPTTNPLADIPKIIIDAGLTVNWIVCPGDLGDKADSPSQAIAWQRLDQIKQALNADIIIGTAGNHDVDSRRSLSDFDPKSALQQLVPTFPTAIQCYVPHDKVYADRFWSKNFVTVPFAALDCSLVILNTCAFHGYASDTKKASSEHLRGRVSPLTLAAVKSEASQLTSRLNIMLLHHHPVKIPFVDDNDSFMLGGDVLIDHLKSTNKQWLVIHGHEHVPHLMYADADQFSPVVLSAGSVAAKTWRVKGGFARNQFHHVSIELPKIEPAGTQIFGKVTSWTWAFENGWQPSEGVGVLPHRAGFGYRFDAIQVRDYIVSTARQAAPQLLPWDAIVNAYPKLPYLIPDDHRDLLVMVRNAGVRIELDPFGIPTRLEWPV
jgi:Calcineurin-like phosphoesterase